MLFAETHHKSHLVTILIVQMQSFSVEESSVDVNLGKLHR